MLVPCVHASVHKHVCVHVPVEGHECQVHGCVHVCGRGNSLDTSHINTVLVYTSQAVVKSIVLHWGFEYSFTVEKAEFKMDRHLLGNKW